MLHPRALTFDTALDAIETQIRDGVPFPTIVSWIDAQPLPADERAALAFVLDGVIRPGIGRIVAPQGWQYD